MTQRPWERLPPETRRALLDEARRNLQPGEWPSLAYAAAIYKVNTGEELDERPSPPEQMRMEL